MKKQTIVLNFNVGSKNGPWIVDIVNIERSDGGSITVNRYFGMPIRLSKKAGFGFVDGATVALGWKDIRMPQSRKLIVVKVDEVYYWTPFDEQAEAWLKSLGFDAVAKPDKWLFIDSAGFEKVVVSGQEVDDVVKRCAAVACLPAFRKDGFTVWGVSKIGLIEVFRVLDEAYDTAHPKIRQPPPVRSAEPPTSVRQAKSVVLEAPVTTSPQSVVAAAENSGATQSTQIDTGVKLGKTQVLVGGANGPWHVAEFTLDADENRIYYVDGCGASHFAPFNNKLGISVDDGTLVQPNEGNPNETEPIVVMKIGRQYMWVQGKAEISLIMRVLKFVPIDESKPVYWLDLTDGTHEVVQPGKLPTAKKGQVKSVRRCEAVLEKDGQVYYLLVQIPGALDDAWKLVYKINHMSPQRLDKFAAVRAKLIKA